MKRIVVSTFVSLDGVMQAPGDPKEDTEGGFTRGGWQMPFFDADSARIMDAQIASTDALLLGRVTYQIFANYWPTAPTDDAIAEKFNRIPKYVVSTTLNKVEWNNSTLIKDNIPEQIAKLKEKQSGPGIISVTGSGKLAQTLMRHNLVDEYYLWIHPIVLGSGKRLFPNGITPLDLKLTDSRTTTSGVIIATYQPK